MREGTATFIDILLAILLPPLGVFLKYECHVRELHPTAKAFNLLLKFLVPA